MHTARGLTSEQGMCKSRANSLKSVRINRPEQYDDDDSCQTWAELDATLILEPCVLAARLGTFAAFQLSSCKTAWYVRDEKEIFFYDGLTFNMHARGKTHSGLSSLSKLFEVRLLYV